MKYPATAIRVAVYDAIKNIDFNGSVVPVFDDMASPEAGFPRIILLDVSGGGARNSKCGFGNDWSQSIKVTTSFTGRVTKNVGELISNEIFEILVPAGGPFIDLSPDFSVWKVEGTMLNVSRYSDGIRSYVDNNIRITYSLTEI